MHKDSKISIILILILIAIVPTLSFGQVSFTILHTNDFHGQLELSGSNPGAARLAEVVNGIRVAKGANNVLLVDAGDEMQGSLLSNLDKGAPTVAVFNAMGYNVATFGNHDFDWGQTVLSTRTTQATYPFVSANIVQGSCDPGNWTPPAFAHPYVIETLATSSGTIKVGFIGVTTTETPIITVASATAGLCFKDPADSIIHYYDIVKTAGADVVVVLSHLGYNDGGYGYGIPVYGDQTLADKLLMAGKDVPLIIGGHSHTNLSSATPVTVGSKTTYVVQAYYNGRTLGQADLTYDTVSGTITAFTWTKNTVSTAGAEDPGVASIVAGYATDPTYLALVNAPVGYSAVDLPRLGGTVDNMMATFIDDAIYNYLSADGDPNNDVDIFFNNAGGIRTDWCYDGATWVNTGCVAGTHAPGLLTYGNMFTILPFGNATVVGDMTGAQVLEVLNKGPQVSNGVIQPAGLKYKYFKYTDANPGPQPYAWGAFDYCVVNKVTKVCEALDLNKTYRVGTNEFLAPAGGDNYGAFKYMTNITYWGDMLNAVNAYVAANHGTLATAYLGPNGDGTLDGRITRDGTDAGGAIIPITILHHNDSHGNLAKGAYVGYTQLAALIKQERAHNPNRTLLLTAGDNIQGDAMMYYFRTAPQGYASDGTPLAPPLTTHPLIAAFNPMGYDAMTLGNHEYDFGKEVFKSVLAQATFPILQANVSDTGAYGLSTVPAAPFLVKTVGPENVTVAVLGIGNHRVPNYQLPSNIPGLTFTDPLVSAQGLANTLRPTSDIVVALSHIGFTENPKSVEVDNKVDTNMAALVSGLDAIVGGHSHTNPASPEAPYKFLPTIVGGPGNTPVLINQAYRYNNTLGEVVIGVRPKGGGGYEVVSRTGQYITVTMSTPEDAATKAIVGPYVTALNSYTGKVIGQTTTPIDSLTAFTQETNGANLQADASVRELAQRGINVDFHLSGAVTNKRIADTATPATPFTLHVSDMLSAIPYDNSLVVLSMNGPQLKQVLERAYRNYYFYKYVPGYGGYSHYTTCMLDIDSGGRILYRDTSPTLPDGNNVVGLLFDGKAVDFSDPSTFYSVSTLNYLAGGSCNFNNGGASLWPLNQIVHDTQFYVRDAVIDYTTAAGTVSPAIEGRLMFSDTSKPVVTVNSPQAKEYGYWEKITLGVVASDTGSGVMRIWAEIDGNLLAGQTIDCDTLSPGQHTLIVHVVDWYGNETTQSILFEVSAPPPPIPALSEWGILVSFLLILGAGLMRMKTRKGGTFWKCER
jgi:2',3'-cyclic-nucleotide 2'-phosphodiesterase (5'-nucleotidase family)